MSEDQRDWIAETPDYLTSDECARIVGVSRDTWTAYVRARRPKHAPPPMPVRTIGRTPVWSEEDVRAWAGARPGRGARLDLRKQCWACGMDIPPGTEFVDTTGPEPINLCDRTCEGEGPVRAAV